MEPLQEVVVVLQIVNVLLVIVIVKMYVSRHVLIYKVLDHTMMGVNVTLIQIVNQIIVYLDIVDLHAMYQDKPRDSIQMIASVRLILNVILVFAIYKNVLQIVLPK